jgi:hypothetical protein
MVPVPEMAAFGEERGFEFHAHEKGDANRSARVERPFDHIDNNFNAGRTASDWADLNRQARLWCDKVNAKHKRHLHASPRELFAQERLKLRPLPEWTPEVYRLYHRLVGVEGFVTVNTNLYSVPLDLPVGRRVEVRETKDRIDIYVGPRLVATHARVLEPMGKRVTHKDHRRQKKERRVEVQAETDALKKLAPALESYVEKLRKRGPLGSTLALRRLLSMIRDYPREPLLQAVAEAERYGLFDLERVERMVLKRIAGDYFLLDGHTTGGPDGEVE